MLPAATHRASGDEMTTKITKTARPRSRPAARTTGTMTRTRAQGSSVPDAGEKPRPDAGSGVHALTDESAATATPGPSVAQAGLDTARSRPGASEAKPRTRWVRQSCRLTEAEYTQLTALKKRAAGLARPVKRGRLLRAGLHSLLCMSDDELFSLLDALPADAGD